MKAIKQIHEPNFLYDKSLIKADFNRASAHYDQNADLQKMVAEKLFSIAEDIFLENADILDIGCGTGFLAAQNKNWKMFQLDISYSMCDKASVLSPAVNADMEILPFADKSFDGAVSSLALQWSNYHDVVFSEVNRVLKPASTFIFSTLGSSTLFELKECFGDERVNNFVSKESLISFLKYSGFKDVSISTTHKKFLYPDLFSLLKKVRGVGAGNKREARHKPLSRNDLYKIEKRYLNKFSDGYKIPATWEILYVTAKK